MDNRKLAIGLANFTPAAREDMSRRADDLERGKTVELLRRAGKEMYDNPVVNTAISFTPGAGDLQSGYEAFNSARQGNWGEAGLNALGVLPFIPSMGFLGKTVWHGSPHTFDKFDLSKIGTGEGAQAYGHGLYFAEAPDVAKQYRDELSRGWKQSYEYKGKPVEKLYEDAVNKGNYGDAMLWEQVQLHGTKDSVRNTLLEEIAGGSNQAKQALKTLETLPDNLFAQPTGSLYKVDLPDEHIAKMLDYDLPLANQTEQVKQSLLQLNDPHINQALSTSPVYNEAGDYWSYTGNTYGSKNEALQDVTPMQLISGQRGSFKSPQEASQRFYEAGIPGVQYLDGGSRGAGEGTRNYVVFSDEIPQILERNGQPVGMFGGGK